jgi:hypothetical protein
MGDDEEGTALRGGVHVHHLYLVALPLQQPSLKYSTVWPHLAIFLSLTNWKPKFSSGGLAMLARPIPFIPDTPVAYIAFPQKRMKKRRLLPVEDLA